MTYIIGELNTLEKNKNLYRMEMRQHRDKKDRRPYAKAKRNFRKIRNKIELLNVPA